MMNNHFRLLKVERFMDLMLSEAIAESSTGRISARGDNGIKNLRAEPTMPRLILQAHTAATGNC
jgi:hypothetical protein